MATRFYFGANDGENAVSPAFDSSWEQQGEATRRKLYRKTTLSATQALANKQVTVPITTTQQILNCQFVSDPIPAQRIIGITYIVVRCSENATTNNAQFTYGVRVVSNDGGTVRGTLLALNDGATEFALHASQSTAIRGDGTTTNGITALTTQTGDRLVVEVGVNAAAPSAAGNAQQRFGTSATSDFALTAGLTTDLNPWIEFSQDIWDVDFNNYRSLRVTTGMSTSGGIR